MFRQEKYNDIVITRTKFLSNAIKFEGLVFSINDTSYFNDISCFKKQAQNYFRNNRFHFELGL